MAQFTPKRLDKNSINGGNRFENGDGFDEAVFNDPIEAILYLQENGGSGGGVDEELVAQVEANTQEIERLSPNVSEQGIAIIDHDNYLNFLKKVLPQSGVYGEATVEEAFYTRTTASGLSVVNDYPCQVKKIKGATELDEVGNLKHANFQKVVSKSRNILRPLSQREYRGVGLSAGSTPRVWDGKTCTYKMSIAGTFTDELSACQVDKENGTITCNFNSDSNGFAMDYPCQSGLWYTCSFKDTQNRAQIRMCFYTKEGTVISGGSGASRNWFCMQAPENAVWGIFIITANAANLGETTYSEFMVEVSTARKGAPSAYEPYQEAEYGNGNTYELRAFDYIDVERQVIVRNTGKYEDNAMDGWDGTVEAGGLSIDANDAYNSGLETTGSAYCRTPYIPVKGGRIVHISGFSGNYYVFYYDNNDGTTGFYGGLTPKEVGFNPSTQYMRIMFDANDVPSKGELKVLYQISDEIAQFKNAIVNTKSTQLVYELDEATETPISINNTYTAYNHGSETVEQGTGDNTTALCTLTIEYTSLGVIE